MDLNHKLLNTQEIRTRYDEFYLASVDYRNMALINLTRSEKSFKNNDINKANSYLKEADRYLNLFNMSNSAAISTYSGNIDASYEFAKGIYEGSKASLKFGTGLVAGPLVSNKIDAVFMTTDFIVNSGELGIKEAQRSFVADAVTNLILNDIHIQSLHGKTLSDVLSDKTTNAIGSSGLYQFMDDILKSPDFQKPFMSILAKSGANVTNEKVSNITQSILEEISKTAALVHK